MDSSEDSDGPHASVALRDLSRGPDQYLERNMQSLVRGVQPELCDVCFVVGSESEPDQRRLFFGISALFMLQSEVFARMLLSPSALRSRDLRGEYALSPDQSRIVSSGHSDDYSKEDSQSSTSSELSDGDFSSLPSHFDLGVRPPRMFAKAKRKHSPPTAIDTPRPSPQNGSSPSPGPTISSAASPAVVSAPSKDPTTLLLNSDDQTDGDTRQRSSKEEDSDQDTGAFDPRLPVEDDPDVLDESVIRDRVITRYELTPPPPRQDGTEDGSLLSLDLHTSQAATASAAADVSDAVSSAVSIGEVIPPVKKPDLHNVDTNASASVIQFDDLTPTGPERTDSVTSFEVSLIERESPKGKEEADDSGHHASASLVLATAVKSQKLDRSGSIKTSLKVPGFGLSARDSIDTSDSSSDQGIFSEIGDEKSRHSRRGFELTESVLAADENRTEEQLTDVCVSTSTLTGARRSVIRGTPLMSRVASVSVSDLTAMELPDSIQHTVYVTDVSTEAFEFLLRFVHFLNPRISVRNLVGVLQISKKYRIRVLKKAGLKFMKQKFGSSDSKRKGRHGRRSKMEKKRHSSKTQMNGHSITLIRVLTDLFKAGLLEEFEHLIRISGVFHSEHIVSFVLSEQFLKVPMELVVLCLQNDELALSEEVIWQRSYEWCRYHSVKKVLMDTSFSEMTMPTPSVHSASVESTPILGASSMKFRSKMSASTTTTPATKKKGIRRSCSEENVPRTSGMPRRPLKISLPKPFGKAQHGSSVPQSSTPISSDRMVTASEPDSRDQELFSYSSGAIDRLMLLEQEEKVESVPSKLVTSSVPLKDQIRPVYPRSDGAARSTPITQRMKSSATDVAKIVDGSGSPILSKTANNTSIHRGLEDQMMDDEALVRKMKLGGKVSVLSREMMTRLAPYLRFPLMDQLFFVHNVVPSQVLSSDDTIAMLSWFVDKSIPVRFSFKPRRSTKSRLTESHSTPDLVSTLPMSSSAAGVGSIPSLLQIGSRSTRLHLDSSQMPPSSVSSGSDKTAVGWSGGRATQELSLGSGSRSGVSCFNVFNDRVAISRHRGTELTVKEHCEIYVRFSTSVGIRTGKHLWRWNLVRLAKEQAIGLINSSYLCEKAGSLWTPDVQFSVFMFWDDRRCIFYRCTDGLLSEIYRDSKCVPRSGDSLTMCLDFTFSDKGCTLAFYCNSRPLLAQPLILKHRTYYPAVTMKGDTAHFEVADTS